MSRLEDGSYRLFLPCGFRACEIQNTATPHSFKTLKTYRIIGLIVYVIFGLPPD
jgi:hypothetical protein